MIVYREARALADDLHREIAGWDSLNKWSLGLQLIRSADSIGANIAEAHGRAHLPDQRRLLHIARGSALELEHWILTADQRGLIDARPFEARAYELARMLNGLIRSKPT